MKFLPIAILALSIFLFSCKPDKEPVKPEPSMTPPEWLIGSWLHSDSTGVTEKMIVSTDDIVLERFVSTGKTSLSYIDSCKTNDLELSDYIKYNSYYNLEFTDKNKETNLVYYAKIGGSEIRVINEVSPTPKTFLKEEN
ncbi:hypothetical protein N9E30_01710 [Flavobacteriales bacterium]|jgi:hypothetical protein|nr:hypothetical protein [Flavobacteriales bacterium]